MNFYSRDDLDKALTSANDNFSNVASISSNDLSLRINLNSEYIRELKKNALSQVKQVIENRVADFGLVEPSIQTTGDDRILIQVPGASQADRERIVDLIRKTAVLEFKIVNAAGITEDIILQGQGVTSKEELASKRP